MVDYADINELPDEAGTFALIDFSGNGTVRHAVHTVLDDRLIESHVVGDTHWDVANTGSLHGVVAQPFFAPSVIVERVVEWGAAGFETRLAAAWTGFIASTGWLRVVEPSGVDAVAAHWMEFAAGRIDPSEGLVLSI